MTMKHTRRELLKKTGTGLMGLAGLSAFAPVLSSDFMRKIMPLFQTELIRTIPVADNPEVELVGNWKIAAIPESLFGKAAMSDSKDDVIRLKATGKNLGFRILGNINCGIFSVSVDGAEFETADAFKLSNDVVAFDHFLLSSLGSGAHTIEIKPTGLGNPKSMGNTIILDAVYVSSINLGLATGTLIAEGIGIGVPDADVLMILDNREYGAVTDRDGKFKITGLIPGDYVVKGSRSGYNDSVLPSVTFTEGQFRDLTVVMPTGRGVRPLGRIRRPCQGIPAFAVPDGVLEIRLSGDSAPAQGEICLGYKTLTIPLNLEQSQKDDSTSEWVVRAKVPQNAPFLLYDIVLKGDNPDRQRNAVKVVKSFPSEYEYIHVTDIHVGKFPKIEETLAQIIAVTNLLNPQFIVNTGDSVDTSGYYSHEDPNKGQWTETGEFVQFLHGIAASQSPVFSTPGNHDIGPGDPDPAAYARWAKYFGPRFFSFDFGDDHFFSFDDNMLHVSFQLPANEINLSPEEPPIKEIDEQQLLLIQDDLKANQGRRSRTALFHVPMHDRGTKMLQFFDDYGVKLALYGHIHVDQVDVIKGKKTTTRFVQTKDAFSDGRFRLIRVKDGEVQTFCYKNVEPDSYKAGKIIIEYPEGNDGKALTARASVHNKLGEDFKNCKLIFSMPRSQKGYNTDMGQIEQTVNLGDVDEVHVIFDLPASSKVAVTVSEA